MLFGSMFVMILLEASFGTNGSPQPSNCGQAAISPNKLFGTSHSCGCSLISPNWAVTAAHCISGNMNPASSRVDLGRHHRDNTEDGLQLKALKQIIKHEHYDFVNMDNDIALLELRDPASLNDQVASLCLPKSDITLHGTNCTITGWGNTEGTCCPNVLKQALVPYVDQTTCRSPEYYGPDDITDNMLCAGYEDGGTDTCQGDSGGPLHVLYTLKNRYQLNGITSWGNGCARPMYPGVYTRVFNYIGWIKEKSGVEPPTD